MPEERQTAIEVRDLRKCYRVPDQVRRGLRSRLMHPVNLELTRELRVFEGISFDVGRGEFFGIVGRNGSGKSTLLRVIASIYAADSGTVTVTGRLAPMIELGVGFDQELSASENIVINGATLGL